MRLHEITPNARRISEGIVYRDRSVQEHNDRRTVVAINPTKAEWDKFFPTGAAGVFLQDGRVVVGDGNCLAHADIMDYASIDHTKEKFRLQLCRSGAWVELWMAEDAWEETHHPTSQEIEAQSVKEYGAGLKQIEAQVAPALTKFMGAVPVRVIPINPDQDPYLAKDKAFVQKCCAANLLLSKP